jgi:hypothetical protein
MLEKKKKQADDIQEGSSRTAGRVLELALLAARLIEQIYRCHFSSVAVRPLPRSSHIL